MTDLQEIAEFDHPFRVAADGSVHDVDSIYAPTVTHDDEDDVAIDGDGWTPLTGHTGQHGYRGAVMHPSETLSGGLADHILSTPGVYVTVVVEVDRTDEDDDPEPAGWAVLKLDECSYIFDGTDTDGTEYFRCLTHDMPAPSHNAPCEAAPAGPLGDYLAPDAETSYSVTWTMELDAASPRQAAELALAVQRDPESTATVFDVSGAGTSVQIDLETN